MSVLVGLLVFGLIMIPVERKWPALARQPRWRRGWRLDIVYWFFTTLITRPVGQLVTAALLFPVLKFSGVASYDQLLDGFGPLGRQPRLDQALQMMVLIDSVGYWLHRWFHSARLWRFHAIHHSSVDLDWLSAARVHPLNDIANKAVAALVVVGLGYSPKLIAGILPLLVAYAILLHANVTWDFGWFRKIFASPKFHRWHHTSAEQGQDKNFSALLPLWDLLFGTYYLPAEQPARFGVAVPVPGGLVG